MVLDTHYGDIRTVLPRLRAKLDKLQSLPEKEEDENKNIQAILNYWKTSRNHGMEERAIDVFFIQEYSEKLSKINKKILINTYVEDCKSVIGKIKQFQRTNLKFLHDNKETLKKSTYQNVNRAVEPEKQKWSAGGHYKGHRGGYAGAGGYDNGRNSGPKMSGL